MNLTNEEVHDLKNQLSIAVGMVDVSVRYLEKNPLDVPKIIDKMERTLRALKKINELITVKKIGPQIDSL